MGFIDLTGLDIQGEPDENDKRSLAAVKAFAETDRYVKPTQESTEKAHELREKNTAMVRGYRWEFQDDLVRERGGVTLHENEFLLRLSKLIPVKPNDWIADGRRGLSVLKDGRYQYVGAMQAGFMREWSKLREDDHRLPTSEEYRGWRTVLIRLILGGFITEKAAHAEFGSPPVGDDSLYYRILLWRFRNRGRDIYDA